jgi:hypothetical protein
LLLTVSDVPHEVNIRLLNDFAMEDTQLWRALKLSMDAPKLHVVEDHLCDQIHQFKGIGDLGEDWVKQSHQEGIRDNKRSRNQMDYNEVATLYCKWEQKRKLPVVQMIIEKSISNQSRQSFLPLLMVVIILYEQESNTSSN